MIINPRMQAEVVTRIWRRALCFVNSPRRQDGRRENNLTRALAWRGIVARNRFISKSKVRHGPQQQGEPLWEHSAGSADRKCRRARRPAPNAERRLPGQEDSRLSRHRRPAHRRFHPARPPSRRRLRPFRQRRLPRHPGGVTHLLHHRRRFSPRRRPLRLSIKHPHLPLSRGSRPSSRVTARLLPHHPFRACRRRAQPAAAEARPL